MPTGQRDRDWIGLSEASRLLGIAPGTLRRWADEGRVSVFTTPGGHRRFDRASIARLLPSARPSRPTLARLGASPDRIARAYRTGRARTREAGVPWIEALSEAERVSFRERGRGLVALLIDHLDAEDSSAPNLQEASQLAADYGREAAAHGSSLSEAVEGFLRFRSPFMAELAAVSRRRNLDTREATALLSRAEEAMDRLVIALMTGHAVESGPRRRRAKAARGQAGQE